MTECRYKGCQEEAQVSRTPVGVSVVGQYCLNHDPLEDEQVADLWEVADR